MAVLLEVYCNPIPYMVICAAKLHQQHEHNLRNNSLTHIAVSGNSILIGAHASTRSTVHRRSFRCPLQSYRSFGGLQGRMCPRFCLRCLLQWKMEEVLD